MNGLTPLEEKNMRSVMWLSLNDLKQLPSVCKAFFDLIISEFADTKGNLLQGRRGACVDVLDY